MTPDIGHICRQHLAFMKWADDLILAAVAEHAPTNIAVLQHVFLGEQVWLLRVQGDKDVQLTHLQAPGDTRLPSSLANPHSPSSPCKDAPSSPAPQNARTRWRAFSGTTSTSLFRNTAESAAGVR